MQLFGIPFTSENIIRAFGVLNATLISVGAYVAYDTGRHAYQVYVVCAGLLKSS